MIRNVNPTFFTSAIPALFGSRRNGKSRGACDGKFDDFKFASFWHENGKFHKYVRKLSFVANTLRQNKSPAQCSSMLINLDEMTAKMQHDSRKITLL